MVYAITVTTGRVTKPGLELATRVRNETDAPAVNEATELDLSPFSFPDPEMPVYDRASRPVSIAHGGHPVGEILA